MIKQPLEMLRPRSLARLTGHLQGMIQGKLWLKIIIALVMGIAVGLIISPDTGLVEENVAQVIGEWLGIPGQIFLGLIQMIVVPLVFASIIRGLAASEDMEQLKSMGIRLIIYFVITTTIAISIGIGVTSIIQPGNYIDTDLIQAPRDVDPIPDNDLEDPSLGTIPQVVTGLLPTNPLGAMVEMEMLQVVLFAIIIGLALITLKPDQSQPLMELLGSLQDVTMTVVRWAMYLAPIAVFGLLAQLTIDIGFSALIGMAVYVGTVLLGLFVLMLVYLIIYLIFTRQSPFVYLKAIREVQLLAFSTSSSAAVMPLSIKTAEEKLNIRSSISQFIIPLGATINMDGTALYQGAATVFLAQVYGVELTLPVLLLVIVTAVGASIGSPATPGVGIIILAMVLRSAGIPTEGVALIIGVDRILDMSRTAINVTGDLTASIVMNRLIIGETAGPCPEEEGEENC